MAKNAQDVNPERVGTESRELEHDPETDQHQGENGQAVPYADADLDGPADPRAGLTYLTMARIGANPELVKLSKDDRIKLGLPGEGNIAFARVYGELTGLTETKHLTDKQTGETRESWGLVGAIEAVNLLTGEFFQAGAWYAPSGFQQMFIDRVESELTLTQGNAKVVFAHEWLAFPAENPRGYSWLMKDLMPLRRHDPLASIRRRALTGSTLSMPQLMPPGGVALG